MADQGVSLIRLMMIHQALKAQIKGFRLTNKAPTGLTIVRKEFGIKARTAAQALPLYEQLLRENGITFRGMEGFQEPVVTGVPT